MTCALARQRASRARRGKLPPLFERGRFVGVDGEGCSDGATVTVTVATPGEAPERVYTGVDHRYALLMDSDGREAWEPVGRLRAKQCLDFLLDIARDDADAIPVIFSGSYDVCHMLAFDLARDDVLDLLREDESGVGRNYLDITLASPDGAVSHDYRIEYRPRKALTVWRFGHGADKYQRVDRRDGTRAWKLAPEARVVLWDVWGFFQGAFVAAMESWLPSDPDLKLIRDMKAKRTTFARSDLAEIRRYTQKELRVLVDLMERVRESVRSLGLSITRWDGAGAIAGAYFKRHDVRAHMAESPPDVFAAARIAYAGGHIEAYKVGHHPGKVWHNDINSAYPHQFLALPSLADGQWIAGAGSNPPPGFTLVSIEFHFTAGSAFYPLFHRSPNGTIRYPERGAGWYWYPEFDAARDFAARFGAYEFRVTGWHHFQTKANASPFSWIEEAYEIRRQIIMRVRETGVPDNSEMMIRLGYNSCYGKTAQQVGARWVDGAIEGPPYFQIEWAGYVTAGCRAQVMRAAMQAPDAIISIATDAVFSTVPLDLPTGQDKRLGEWECKVHDGMTIVMPGVYWLHDTDKIRHYSRGFDKEKMSDPEIVHAAWRRGATEIGVPTHRMITLGAAMMSENFWQLRGLFVTTERMLQLNGRNSKRNPIAMSRARPWERLEATWPRGLSEDVGQSLGSLMSEPYGIKWLDYVPDDSDGADDSGDGAAASFLLDSREAAESPFLV